jgi:hypothetical protein
MAMNQDISQSSPSSDRIWTNLKTFVQECYTCCLNATSITTGVQGYVQNAFATLAKDLQDGDDDVQTVIMQMAALTTQSQLTASMTAETNASVTLTINQLAANQQAMQQQFVAFASMCNTTYQPALPAPPPIPQFATPNFEPFQPVGIGGGGRRGGRGRGKCANAGRQNGRGGQGGITPIGGCGGCGGGGVPFAQQNAPRNTAPIYSNIINWYVNWNVCFSCSFDVEDGHTSKTCSAPWNHGNHQEG